MTMRMDLAWAAAAGAALGAAYFGSLWWTVRRLSTARHPALLMMGSYLLRVAALLAGVLLVCGTDWKRLVACLVGLLISRILVLRVLGPIDAGRLAAPPGEAARAIPVKEGGV